MKTKKIVRFTRNFDRRHRTDVYLYANTYEDITSLIENEINDNVYGISDYPISNTVESELYESLNMAFWEEQYEDDYERFENMLEKFHDNQNKLATEEQWREAVLDNGERDSRSCYYWWVSYEAMTLEEFSRRLSKKRSDKLMALYGCYSINQVYNIYLDYVEAYYDNYLVENPDRECVQNEIIKDFWNGILSKTDIEFSNGISIIFSEGLPEADNCFEED